MEEVEENRRDSWTACILTVFNQILVEDDIISTGEVGSYTARCLWWNEVPGFTRDYSNKCEESLEEVVEMDVIGIDSWLVADEGEDVHRKDHCDVEEYHHDEEDAKDRRDCV